MSNEELLIEIRSLLVRNLAETSGLALRMKRLEESYNIMRSEMKSNYVGYEGWAKELMKGNK
jgi:hypothetical protein